MEVMLVIAASAVIYSVFVTLPILCFLWWTRRRRDS